MVGLAGVSLNSRRVFSRIAPLTAAGSEVSAKVISTPKRWSTRVQYR